jgi:hypothetical protein
MSRGEIEMSGVIFKERQKVPYGNKTTRFSLKINYIGFQVST